MAEALAGQAQKWSHNAFYLSHFFVSIIVLALKMMDHVQKSMEIDRPWPAGVSVGENREQLFL